MSAPLLSLIRSDLQGFTGYSSAAGEAAGVAPSVKVDANESPWPPFGRLATQCNVNRYAEPQPLALRARMAAMWSVSVDQIILTAGSSQAIEILIRLFCAAGQDEVLVCPPTFSMYEVYARIQGARILCAPLAKNGQLDLAAIEQTATDQTKIIFIPTPNAPMGHTMDRTDILKLCALRGGKSVIVADEAYAEFSDSPDGMIGDLSSTPNLVVLRTLSKAYGLAGERVGCAVGPSELISALQAIISPYPLAQSAVQAALDVLSPAGLALAQQRIALVCKERERLAQRLRTCESVQTIYPSQGNFLLLQTSNAAAFLNRLRRFDITARNMSAQTADCVRLSVGSEAENDLVLTALDLDASRTATNERIFSVQRVTKETAIDVVVNLDNPSVRSVQTGLGFFDHMLDQIATHGGLGLTLCAKGDLDVDMHHTIEDCALALGEVLRGALGDKKGTARFGFTAPLDESIASIVFDLSGRPHFELTATWPRDSVDGISPDLVEHFFRSLSTALGSTLHIAVRGANRHHMIEACFKAFGRALRQAIMRDGNALPSTKGVL